MLNDKSVQLLEAASSTRRVRKAAVLSSRFSILAETDFLHHHQSANITDKKMSYTKQGERFGRVTGHTLRRNPQSNHYTGQFVIMKRTNRSGSLSYDEIDGQFQALLSDGHLQGSSEMVYSLNKQKRWELPGLLKESICKDGDIHEDLDFKVLLVEQHLDSQSVFRPACTSLYESKTSRPERLPRKKYAHAWDLHKRDQRNKAQQEALCSQINKLRCAKNRGGKKVNWRSMMDAMQERIREEEQRQEEEEEDMPQLRYEVGYGRPENKYPWRPEMKMNSVTSKGSMGTKQRHKGNTTYYLEEAYNMQDDSQDDIFEEVRSHSEAESHLQEDAINNGLIVSENRPMLTFGEALCGLRKRSKQCKKRRRNKSDSTTTQPAKRHITSNQATSESVKVHDKGSVVYDPEGIIYKPQPKTYPRRHRGNASAPSMAISNIEDDSNNENQSLVCLQVDQESVKPSRLKADFGLAYSEADCKPRKFAVQVSDVDTDLPSNPKDSVYALFEYLREASTMVECAESEEAQSWLVVKKGLHMRMTVYGKRERLLISSESLAAAFPSTNIFSIQEVMKHLQSEYQTSATCWNRTQRRAARSSLRRISSDIPTVRAALGWDCRFSTADEAYREMIGRQTHQSCDDSDVQDLAVTPDTCGICYESLSLGATDGASVTAHSAGSLEATILASCGHCFCNDCWRQYLRSGVKQGAADITCPEYKCKTPVDPVTTMAFLSPAQFHAHYRCSRDTALARSAQCHRCPNPLCGHVARIVGGADSPSESADETRTRTNDAAAVVRCAECRWLWCTKCMEEGHWPASCQQAKDYRALLKTKLREKETPIITHVQVKRCPGCKTRWEKNGGCPSMICGACRLNFCWLCLRTFDGHDFNSCRKSIISLESVYFDLSSRSKDCMLELAVEHHKHRFGSALRKDWFAAAKLASRSAMAHLSVQRSAGVHTPPLLTMDIVMATSSATNHQPLTWARTQEHLELMNSRAEESYEIASFCHESNFVLEHLAFLLGSLPRRRRKTKWWRAMLKLRFIVQNLEETLGNLPNIKRSDSGVTMDRLCSMMHAGKECLRKLARSLSCTVPQGHDATD